MTVILETLSDPSGFNFGVFTPSGVSPSTGSFTPLISLRLKTVFNTKENRMKVIINQVNMKNDSGTVYAYALIWNPVLTGASWTSVDTLSGMERDFDATSLTGGVIMNTGIFSETSAANLKKNILDYNGFPFGLSVDGTTSDVIVFAAQRIGGGQSSVFASVDWEEIY